MLFIMRPSNTTNVPQQYQQIDNGNTCQKCMRKVIDICTLTCEKDQEKKKRKRIENCSYCCCSLVCGIACNTGYLGKPDWIANNIFSVAGNNKQCIEGLCLGGLWSDCILTNQKGILQTAVAQCYVPCCDKILNQMLLGENPLDDYHVGNALPSRPLISQGYQAQADRADDSKQN